MVQFRQKTGFILLSAMVLLTLVSCGSGACSAPWSAEGEVAFLQGELSINGTSASIGDPVPADAELITGSGAMAEIIFGSGNVIRLEENSLLRLDLASDSISEMDLRRGAVSAVLEGLQRLEGEESLRIRSATALAGVRGTSFFMKVEEPDVTYFCLCNGSLDLGTADGDLSPIDAARHDAYRIIRTADGFDVRPAPLLYHDDDSMQSLADRIDVSIDWGYSGGYGNE
jgi:hypothetical protein